MGIRQRTVRDGDRLHNVWEQPAAERATIMEQTRQDRDQRRARKTGWSEPLLRIPLEDRVVLQQRRPELFQGDGQQRRKAMVKFANSAEGAPYRLMPKGRSRAFAFIRRP